MKISLVALRKITPAGTGEGTGIGRIGYIVTRPNAEGSFYK